MSSYNFQQRRGDRDCTVCERDTIKEAWCPSNIPDTLAQGAVERCSTPTPRHQEGRSCKHHRERNNRQTRSVPRAHARMRQVVDAPRAAYTPPLDIERTERDRRDVLRLLMILLPNRRLTTRRKMSVFPCGAGLTPRRTWRAAVVMAHFGDLDVMLLCSDRPYSR